MTRPSARRHTHPIGVGHLAFLLLLLMPMLPAQESLSAAGLYPQERMFLTEALAEVARADLMDLRRRLLARLESEDRARVAAAYAARLRELHNLRHPQGPIEWGGGNHLACTLDLIRADDPPVPSGPGLAGGLVLSHRFCMHHRDQIWATGAAPADDGPTDWQEDTRRWWLLQRCGRLLVQGDAPAVPGMVSTDPNRSADTSRTPPTWMDPARVAAWAEAVPRLEAAVTAGITAWLARLDGQTLDSLDCSSLVALITRPLVGRDLDDTRRWATEAAEGRHPRRRELARLVLSAARPCDIAVVGLTRKLVPDLARPDQDLVLAGMETAITDAVRHLIITRLAAGDSLTAEARLRLLTGLARIGDPLLSEDVRSITSPDGRPDLEDLDRERWHRLLDRLGVAPITEPRETLVSARFAEDPYVLPAGSDKPVAITIRAWAYPEGEGGSRVPEVGATFRIAVRDDPAGRSERALTSDRLQTGPDGRAVTAYQPPPADAGLPQDGAVELELLDAAGRRCDVTAIRFERDQAGFEARPRLGRDGPCVIPADPRFPATVVLTLRDAQGAPLAGQTAKIVVGGPGDCWLRTADGAEGERLTQTTDADGRISVAVHARPNGEPLPRRYTITASVQPPREGGRRRPRVEASATVEVGLDLAIRDLRPVLRGEAAAGEDIPVAVELVDRLRPGWRDLTPILGHWLESAGGHTLGVRVTIDPAGQVPTYLTDLIDLEHRQQPVDAFGLAWYDREAGRTVVLVPQNGGSHHPRAHLTTSGLNLFRVGIQTATVVAGPDGRSVQPLAGAPSVGLCSIPAGIRANAAAIFLLEDPFAARDRQGRLLRALAGLNDVCDGVMGLSELINRINRGEVEGLASILLGRLYQSHVKRLAKRWSVDAPSLGEAALTSAAAARMEVAGLASLLSAYQGEELALDDRLIARLAAASGSALGGERRLVVIRDPDGTVRLGGADLGLVDGQPLADAQRGLAALRTGAFTVLSAPAAAGAVASAGRILAEVPTGAAAATP